MKNKSCYFSEYMIFERFGKKKTVIQLVLKNKTWFYGGRGEGFN